MICAVCGTAFEATRKDARYCSQRCRQRAYESRQTGTIRQELSVREMPVVLTDRLTDNLTDNLTDVPDDDAFDKDLDALAARVQNGERLSLAEIEAGIAYCSRVFDDPEDKWLSRECKRELIAMRSTARELV